MDVASTDRHGRPARPLAAPSHGEPHADDEDHVTEAAPRTPRQDFRVLTRTRGGYDGGVMYDVQLQVAASGSLVWAQTFSDQQQAEEFQEQLEDDMASLEMDEFRRKYSVPSTA